MSDIIAWRCIGDATVQIPGTCNVHEPARQIPRIRLILYVFQL